MLNYTVDIRRYTAGNDEDYSQSFDSILKAHEFISNQARFGVFRAWVNNKEIRNAYHGVSLEDVMAAVDPKLAAAAEAFGRLMSGATA